MGSASGDNGTITSVNSPSGSNHHQKHRGPDGHTDPEMNSTVCLKRTAVPLPARPRMIRGTLERLTLIHFHSPLRNHSVLLRFSLLCPNRCFHRFRQKDMAAEPPTPSPLKRSVLCPVFVQRPEVMRSIYTALPLVGCSPSGRAGRTGSRVRRRKNRPN